MELDACGQLLGGDDSSNHESNVLDESTCHRKPQLEDRATTRRAPRARTPARTPALSIDGKTLRSRSPIAEARPTLARTTRPTDAR